MSQCGQCYSVIKTFQQECMQVLMTDMDETMILHQMNKYILFAYYVQDSVLNHVLMILFPSIGGG